MSSMRQISNQQLIDVMAKLRRRCCSVCSIKCVNANDYLRSVLVKALGEERANNLLDEDLRNP